MRRIFVAGPITGLIDKHTGLVRESFKKDQLSLIEFLRGDGHNVYSAHERESWGSKLDEPKTALKLDLEAIREADLLIARLGPVASPGVHVEIGFALAIGCPLITLHGKRFKKPYLLDGYSLFTKHINLEMDSNQIYYRKISSFIESLN